MVFPQPVMILLIATQASLPDATEMQELQSMIRKKWKPEIMLKQKDCRT
jgi:hypothetical protein